MSTVSVATINLWLLSSLGGISPSPLNLERVRAFCGAITAQQSSSGPSTILSATERPDILLIQEAWDERARKILITECGYPEFYDANDPSRTVDNGLLILSRFQMSKQFLMGYTQRGHESRSLLDGEFLARKALLGAEVEIPRGTNVDPVARLTLLTTHLIGNYSSSDLGRDIYEGIRLDQLREALNRMKVLNGPIIFAGDFNFSDQPGFWAQLRTVLGLNDVFSSHPELCTYCPPNQYVQVSEGRLDRIFSLGLPLSGIQQARRWFDQPIDVVVQDRRQESRVVRLYASDHFGLFANFELPGAP